MRKPHQNHHTTSTTSTYFFILFIIKKKLNKTFQIEEKNLFIHDTFTYRMFIDDYYYKKASVSMNKYLLVRGVYGHKKGDIQF